MQATVRDKIDETREVLHKALAEPTLSGIGKRLRGVLDDGKYSVDLLRSVISLRGAANRSKAITSVIGPELLRETAADALVQRYLLVQTAFRSLAQLGQLKVHPAVMRLICTEFQFFCCPAARNLNLFKLDSPSFWSYCKVALLERFPAGQYHWELSGFPRSYLFKVPLRSMPRVARFIATQTRGFSSLIEPHMSPRLTLITEKESNKAWYRMARSVEGDLSIHGLVAISWLHSPDTYKVSPHLSFINKPFVESGAVITTMGEVQESSGFLTGSQFRRKLYESGEFKPTQGVVLWSRQQMVRWANAHPELE